MRAWNDCFFGRGLGRDLGKSTRIVARLYGRPICVWETARWSQKIRTAKRAEGIPSGDLFRRDDNVVIYRFLGIVDFIGDLLRRGE
jgi:hypothetical protein